MPEKLTSTVQLHTSTSTNLPTAVHLHLFSSPTQKPPPPIPQPLTPNLPISFTKLTGVSPAEVRAAMRAHDTYVLSSNAEEGWGAALNEALEEGMSALGTYEAGASAAILPRERLYHAGDVKALARLLEAEYRGTLPRCTIGEWTAAKAA